MVKEIERFGIPIVHMATISTISQSVGANRIVPTVAIPYPTGNPELSEKNELAIRHDLVEAAIELLGTEISESTVKNAF